MNQENWRWHCPEFTGWKIFQYLASCSSLAKSIGASRRLVRTPTVERRCYSWRSPLREVVHRPHSKWDASVTGTGLPFTKLILKAKTRNSQHIVRTSRKSLTWLQSFFSFLYVLCRMYGCIYSHASDDWKNIGESGIEVCGLRFGSLALHLWLNFYLYQICVCVYFVLLEERLWRVWLNHTLASEGLEPYEVQTCHWLKFYQSMFLLCWSFSSFPRSSFLRCLQVMS